MQDLRQYIPAGILPSRKTLTRLAQLDVSLDPPGLGTDANYRLGSVESMKEYAQDVLRLRRVFTSARHIATETS